MCLNVFILSPYYFFILNVSAYPEIEYALNSLIRYDCKCRRGSRQIYRNVKVSIVVTKYFEIYITACHINAVDNAFVENNFIATIEIASAKRRVHGI